MLNPPGGTIVVRLDDRARPVLLERRPRAQRQRPRRRRLEARRRQPGVTYNPTTTDCGSTTDQVTRLKNVAKGIGDALPAPYTYTVTVVNGVVTLKISNPAGFSLNGTGSGAAQINGLIQVVQSANTITRSTTATQGNGTTPITFTAPT